METLRRLFRFALVSGFGTAAHYALLVALVEAALVRPVLATIAGSVVGALVNYSLSRRWVFASQRTHQQALPRFLAIAGVGLILNAVLMAAFNQQLNLPYLLAQMVATVLVMLWHYGANATWTFTESKH